MGRLQTRLKRLVIVGVLAYCICCMSIVSSSAAQSEPSDDVWIGPYLNRIRYVAINGSDTDDDYRAQVRALVDGDIDMMTTQTHDTDDIQTLRESENIERVDFWRSAVWELKINCQDSNWPFNISGVRKALHHAINKTAMNILQGTRVHDSYLISPLPFSIESEMDYHYYDADVEKANEILDDLGFIDIDHDGYREGPHGEEIPSIEVEFNRQEGGGPLLEDAANLVVDAFESMNMSAHSKRDWDAFAFGVERSNNLDFGLYILGMLGHDYTLDSWFRYWPTYRTDWNNSTFDALVDTILHSTNYDEVTEAMKEAQYILVEDAPGIPIMQMPLFSAYRTDIFEGFVEHPSYGPHSMFSYLKVFNYTENSTGGTLTVGTIRDRGSGELRIYLPHQTFAIHTQNFFSTCGHMDLLVESLAALDTNLNAINWLAESYTIETYDDDPSIPEGNTRILIRVVDNAKWSDGTPLTAEDVAFSINWYSINHPGVHEELADMYRCVVRNPSEVEIQFTEESFWYWYKICFIPIIPAHVPDQYDSVLVDSFTGSILVPSEIYDQDLVVSGPFMVSEWSPSEYIELVQNPYYWKNPMNIPEEVNDTTDTTQSPPIDLTLPLVSGAIGATSVIIVGGVIIQRKFS